MVLTINCFFNIVDCRSGCYCINSSTTIGHSVNRVPDVKPNWHQRNQEDRIYRILIPGARWGKQEIQSATRWGILVCIRVQGKYSSISITILTILPHIRILIHLISPIAFHMHLTFWLRLYQLGHLFGATQSSGFQHHHPIPVPHWRLLTIIFFLKNFLCV